MKTYIPSKHKDFWQAKANASNLALFKILVVLDLRLMDIDPANYI